MPKSHHESLSKKRVKSATFRWPNSGHFLKPISSNHPTKGSSDTWGAQIPGWTSVIRVLSGRPDCLGQKRSYYPALMQYCVVGLATRSVHFPAAWLSRLNWAKLSECTISTIKQLVGSAPIYTPSSLCERFDHFEICYPKSKKGSLSFSPHQIEDFLRDSWEIWERIHSSIDYSSLFWLKQFVIWESSEHFLFVLATIGGWRLLCGRSLRCGINLWFTPTKFVKVWSTKKMARLWWYVFVIEGFLSSIYIHDVSMIESRWSYFSLVLSMFSKKDKSKLLYNP